MFDFQYLSKSLRYIFSRFLLARKYLVATSTKYGVVIKFKTQDGGGRKIYKTGTYEEEISDFLLNYLSFKEGDILFDIGANIGWYSVLLSKHFENGIRIFSFEPDPINYHCLVDNLARNHSEAVEPVQLGVSSTKGKKALHLYKNSNIGRHSMLDINDGPTVEVHATTLDDFICSNKLDIGKIQFLKIDIEGYELQAFRGADTLLRQIPLMLAEFSPGYMRKGGEDPKALLDLLIRQYGLLPYELIGNQLKRADYNMLLERNTNINLFWKRS